MTLPGSIQSSEEGVDSLALGDKAVGRAAGPAALNQLRVGDLARTAGFIEAGIVGLPYAETNQDAGRFAAFVEEGRAGTMQWLAQRNEQQELVRSRVGLPFPWARSAIVCLASYHADAPLSIDEADVGAGWIARYAWSGKLNSDGTKRPADYHKLLLKRLKELESEMHAEYGDFDCRAYVDTGPVVERSLARAAGVGWTGKNTCLIHPKLGSWNFLAVLVTSLELPIEAKALAVPDRCGSCRRCLDACPTQALIEPYQMDASRCISYLTIEHRGEIAEDLRVGMGRQVFGCDICQDVCPWNRKAPIQPAADNDWFAREELVNPSLEWLAGLEEADFERLFNGSPVRRTGFDGLRRNIAIAMGNIGLDRFRPWLEQWAGLDADSIPMAGTDEKAWARRLGLRSAARWALGRLTGGTGS